jgi:catechol-2,3-dioxygenase
MDAVQQIKSLGNAVRRQNASEQADVASEQPQIWPESERPPWMQRLPRPTSLIRADKLLFLIFEKPNLSITANFLRDFGMIEVARTDDELIMRGAGSVPVIYMARRGQASKFIGCAFSASTANDLQLLVEQADAQSSEIGARWGAKGVVLRDPAGFEVHVLHGIRGVEELRSGASAQTQGVNTPDKTVRLNNTLRPPLAPAEVVCCSHVVLQVTDFQSCAHWYMRTLGLIPSDVQVLPDGTPNLVFMRLDRGDSPADHHAIVIAGGIENMYMHSAYEVCDLDAMGQGHQYLRSKKWKPAWGLGRHFIGSQLFDYWFDPDGHEMEHMADSDRLDSRYETGYSRFDRKSLWMWGQDLPAHMAPPKNPILILGVLRRIFSGQLQRGRVKQIVQAMRKPPRSWIQ